MSIEGQGHSLTLVKGHSDFKVKCLTFGLYTQVSDSGPLGPLVLFVALEAILFSETEALSNFGKRSPKEHFCEIIWNRSISLGGDVI